MVLADHLSPATFEGERYTGGDDWQEKIDYYMNGYHALKKAAEDGAEVTDDCSAVELLGMTVKTVEGDERNLKVTTPLDLKLAEMLMEEMV